MTDDQHARTLPYLLELLLALKGTAAAETVKAEIIERYGHVK